MIREIEPRYELSDSNVIVERFGNKVLFTKEGREVSITDEGRTAIEHAMFRRIIQNKNTPNSSVDGDLIPVYEEQVRSSGEALSNMCEIPADQRQTQLDECAVRIFTYIDDMTLSWADRFNGRPESFTLTLRKEVVK